MLHHNPVLPNPPTVDPGPPECQEAQHSGGLGDASPNVPRPLLTGPPECQRRPPSRHHRIGKNTFRQVPHHDTHAPCSQLLPSISSSPSILHFFRRVRGPMNLNGSSGTKLRLARAHAPRLTLPYGSPTMESEAVLDGELAVPCTRNPLQRGGIPLERPVPTGPCPRRAALMVWSHAAQPREPRQVREEATVSEQLRVPWECLA